MPLDTSVKWFHSGITGAPVMSGLPGSMIGVLDACLVNGWGSTTVDSVVIAGGIATVTRGAGHPFEADMVCEIAGATVTGGTLNGQRKVIASLSATQYTIDADGIPNQTATGTITHKIAAAGWQKVFTGTNIAVYRSQDVTGTRFYLRVDDSGANNARVVAYETMGDINTGTGAFPRESQQSGGFFWARSNLGSADSTPRRWAFAGDGKFFQLPVNWIDAVSTDTRYGYNGLFGDVVRPAGSTDSYACIIHGSASSLTGFQPGAQTQEYHSTSSATSSYFPRPPTGVGQSVAATRNYAVFIGSTNGVASGESNANHIAFPNPSNGGVYVSEWHSVDTNFTYRGKVPGFYAIPQRCGGTAFSNRQRLTGVTSLTGRAVRVLNTSVGCVAVDCTGPWV
jgi:hypothetical protein